MSKKKKSNKRVTTVQSPEKSILNYLEHLHVPTSQRQIVRHFNIKSRNEKADLGRFLNDLVRAGKLKRTDDRKYVSTGGENVITGKVDHVNKKYAFIVSAETEQDVMVRTEHLKFAFDGDIVKVSIQRLGNSTKRPEGKVLEIVERSREEFVGRVDLSDGFGFVIPDNRKIYQDFFIHPDSLEGLHNNDKVIIRVSKWPNDRYSAEGKIVKILGKAGENEVEIHSIMAEFGLPFEFEERVLDAAEAIPAEITDKEIKKRKEFRQKVTFTIDPEDAKDFDDALSLEFLPNGNVEVGIHIADVTHYVDTKGIIEKEAYERATSVYLVDRTIPMLPERLSNGLCSLNPKEDKLTFSAVFELDKDARIINEWFGRTIIHSDHRFTYEQAQEVLETGEGLYKDELFTLNKFAKKLKAQRFKQGAINFETVEVKFQLDEKGIPLAVIPKVRKDAHKLIEEFMLLANKRVATYIYDMEDHPTFVYRTHDNPDPEKLKSFSVFAKRFGHHLDVEGNISKSLNTLMDNIEGKPEQNVLESIAIRAMAKAKYTTSPDPHFGLAFEHYTHFTSPIRRYPDMMVHRLLQHYLDGGKSADLEKYETRCEHSSDMEKRAAEAERASIKYKQVEYMSLIDKKPFEGIISGVTDWGIFVEIIETKCEGMIRLSDLDDDYYEYDEDNYRVIGRHNKKMFTLGDKITVLVRATDIDRRTIDLEIFDEY